MQRGGLGAGVNPVASDGWVCRCRRCHGVHNTADAVQHAYESCIGVAQTDMVVAFGTFGVDGRCTIEVPFLECEPDVLDIAAQQMWVYSWRPGRSAVPTEGDIARWERWPATEKNLVDWIVIDGTSWTSVRTVVAALRERRRVPAPETYTNFWWEEN